MPPNAGQPSEFGGQFQFNRYEMAQVKALFGAVTYLVMSVHSSAPVNFN
ncbi:Uncharacterised protein [Serratia grimesii]|nr:Uncharacterised protein [Serratia grimesii]CAI1172591.1 Uncharacterised protein [Serratia grimesii]CAI2432561.1 Uncharacterised protein [Serratia grimesii]SUI33646.1 Uncharacterised protein [Serratia grimesii]